MTNTSGIYCKEADANPSTYAFGLTRCIKRTQAEMPPRGIKAAALVGQFTNTQLIDLMQGSDTPLTTPKWVRWSTQTPSKDAAKIQARRAALALKNRLFVRLKEATPEVELTYKDEATDQEWDGRADWVTREGTPIEIKVSDRYSPGWLVQLAHYIVACGAVDGMLAMVRNTHTALCSVDVAFVTSSHAAALVRASGFYFNPVRPSATECGDCFATDCAFNSSFGRYTTEGLENG